MCSGGIRINDANVIIPDVTAGLSVVHVIDKVCGAAAVNE